MIIRQGDVMLRKVAAMTAGAIEQEPTMRGVVLAEGEATGHAHRIFRGAVMFRDDGAGRAFVAVSETTSLTHEEHDTIPLLAGIYELVGQVEWSDEHSPRHVED